MIYIFGKIISISKKSLILESNYIGYSIIVANSQQYELNKFKKIFVYEYRYENSNKKIIYGFREYKERLFFEDLLSIQGIGPKISMSILSSGWKNVMNDIANANIEDISKIPFVGEKIARKIIFDFQRKYNSLIEDREENKEENKNKLEVYKTLKSLGFNEKQINLVSSKIKNADNIDQMIEEAIELISHEQQNNSNIIKTQ